MIDQFDPDDSIAIKKSQDSFNDKVVERDLHFIKNYFSCIPETITKLEKFGLELKDSLEIFNDCKGVILPHEFPAKVSRSFKYCLLTSVDVERTFLVFKNILTDRRLSLTAENLEKIITIYCFNNNNNYYNL